MSHSMIIRQGETSPWEFTLKDADGAVDLTGAASVKLYLKEPGQSTMTVDGEDVAVEDETSGQCSYTPRAVDVEDAVTLRGHVTVTRTAGDAKEKYPQEHDMEIVIRPALDG